MSWDPRTVAPVDLARQEELRFLGEIKKPNLRDLAFFLFLNSLVLSQSL